MFFFLCFFFNITGMFSQAVQWSISADVADSGSEQNLSDWIYDVITNTDGNYVAVGFAKESETNPARKEVPSFCRLRTNGTLLNSGFIETTAVTEGRLFNVVEASNGDYYAVGYSGAKATRKGLLVRIDKSSFGAQVFNTVPSGFGVSRLSEISEFVQGNTKLLIVSGEASVDENAPAQRWIASFNYSGTKLHEFVFPLQSSVSEKLNTIACTANGSLIDIYYAAYDQILVDGGFGSYRRHDSDIKIGRITYNPILGTFTEVTNSVNSILQNDRDSKEITSQAEVGVSTIFGMQNGKFAPKKKDSYPYGPKYINTDFARKFDNCSEESPDGEYFIEDWSDGSEDEPHSMVLSGNQIVVSATLNRLIMFPGSNDVLGNDGSDDTPGLTCSANDCSTYSGGYLWAEGYLLFFNKTTLALENATHLGTMSGGDFIPKVIKTTDGGFAVSGTRDAQKGRVK